MPILRSFPIEITPEMMYIQQGRDPQARPLPERAELLYRQSIERATALAEPIALYEVFDVVPGAPPEVLTLSNGQAFQSRLIVHQLASAEQLAVAVCTIGPRVPAAATQAFADGESMMGFLLDSAGSLAVGSAARGVIAHLNQLATDRGLKASFSIAPGSAECTLEDQRVVFALLPTADIGVRLTETLLMVPVKSVSLVVGFGKDLPTGQEHAQCDFCPRKETCPHAKLRGATHAFEASGHP